MEKYGLYWPVVIIVGLLLAAIPIIWIKSEKSTKKESGRDWTPADRFRDESKKMKPKCSVYRLDEYMKFLRQYKGGFVRNQIGQVTFQEYLMSERATLKGIFFNIVMPNPKLTSAKKEEFRALIISLGVEGIDSRPEYETRDAKLKNNKVDEDEFLRKQVGNTGEKMVRDRLQDLKDKGYAVINGPALRGNGTVKEFDHIVIGPTGVFFLETKAYGMRDGESQKGNLYIEEGDVWKIRRGKYEKELNSPTKQMELLNELLSKILENYPAEIHPLLALSNSKLQVNKSIDLPFDIVTLDEAVDYILNCNDYLEENDKVFMLGDIDKCRVN